MDILKSSNLFPYLEGLHFFNKKDQVVTIKNVTSAKLPDFQGNDKNKEVVYFQETDKGLVLNKTNVKMLVKLLGRETDEWRGKKIKIGHEWVKAFGDTVHAVRIRDEQLNNGKPDKPTNGKKPKQVQPQSDPIEIALLVEVNEQTDNYYQDIDRLLTCAKRHNDDIDPDNLADEDNIALIKAAAIEYASVPSDLDGNEPDQAPLFPEEEPIPNNYQE